MNKYYVTYEGKELGTIKASSYEEALRRVEEVVSIEADADNEEDELVELVQDKIEGYKDE